MEKDDLCIIFANTMLNTNNQNNFYYGYNRDKTRLGNRGTMEDDTIRKTLGKQSQGDGVYQTIKAGNKSGNAGCDSFEERALSFTKQIEQAAKDNNVWFENAVFSLTDGVMIGKGGEAQVYKSNDDIKAIKIFSLIYMVDSEDLIYKIAANNQLFPETRYHIIGFTRDEKNEVSAILEQPFVQTKVRASQDVIDKYVQSIGFERIEDTIVISGSTIKTVTYQNSEFRISDAVVKDTGDNVLVDENGTLYFIDPFIVPAKVWSENV